MLIRRTVFSIIILLVSANMPILAGGWPDDGWEGLKSLNFTHKTKLVDLDAHHTKLAQQENEISQTLPPQTTTNVVLVTVSLLYDEGLRFSFILGPSEKPYAFESGWGSALMSNPALDEAQNALKPYALQFQKLEGLNLQDKASLLDICRGVVKKQGHFEAIMSRFHFQESTPDIKDVLAQIEATFIDIQEGAPGYTTFLEFKKDAAAYNLQLKNLEDTKKDACANLVALSQKLDLANLNDKLLKDIEEETKSYRTLLFKQEQTIRNIGAKVIVTYWHSEQKLIRHIQTQTASILDKLPQEKTSPDAILISIHSRFDICKACSHSIVCSYTTPTGVLSQLRDSIYAKLAINDVPFYVTASFREARPKITYQPGLKILKTLSDLGGEDLYPAFPVLQVRL